MKNGNRTQGKRENKDWETIYLNERKEGKKRAVTKSVTRSCYARNTDVLHPLHERVTLSASKNFKTNEFTLHFYWLITKKVHIVSLFFLINFTRKNSFPRTHISVN